MKFTKRHLLIYIQLVIEFLAILEKIAVLTTFFAFRRQVKTQNTYPKIGNILEVNGKRVHALVMGEVPDLVLIDGPVGICAIIQHLLPLSLLIPIVKYFYRLGLGH